MAFPYFSSMPNMPIAHYVQCGGILEMLDGEISSSYLVLIKELNTNNAFNNNGFMSTNQNSVVFTIINCINDNYGALKEHIEKIYKKDMKIIIYNQNGKIISVLLLYNCIFSEIRFSNIGYVSDVFFDNIPIALTRKVLIEKSGNIKKDFSMLEIRGVFDSYQEIFA